MKWENINVKQLNRHLSLVYERKVINDFCRSDVIPIPKSKTTLNSFINPKKTAKATNGDSQFSEAPKEPSVETGWRRETKNDLWKSNLFRSMRGK